MDKDIRLLSDCEIRMTTDSGKPVVEIEGVRFGVWSQNLGGFQELIERSAYNDKTDMSDVRALLNHLPSYVLGRTARAGTLQLDLRSDSLWGIVTPPDTQWMRDLQVSLERRDIDGASHGFYVEKNNRDVQKWDFTGTIAKRTIRQVAKLDDLSVVTYGAYQQASSSLSKRNAQTVEEARAEFDALLSSVTLEDLESAIRSGSVGVETQPDGSRLTISDDPRFAGRVLTALPDNSEHRGLPLSIYQHRLRALQLTLTHQ